MCTILWCMSLQGMIGLESMVIISLPHEQFHQENSCIISLNLLDQHMTQQCAHHY